MTTGIAGFEEAMTSMRLTAEVRGEIVVTKLEVPIGPYAGKTIEVGADPPADFPTVPPHWVHLPDTIELEGGGKNPSELGAGWAKWSRPHKHWVDAVAPGPQWTAHARALLAAAVA